MARTSVLGSEHVLNDRFIAFSNILRKNFDWRGWAARGQDELCYDAKKRTHSACGGIDAYLNPQRPRDRDVDHGRRAWPCPHGRTANGGSTASWWPKHPAPSG